MTYKSPLSNRPLRPTLRCGFVQDHTGPIPRLAWMVWQPGRSRKHGLLTFTYGGRPLVWFRIPRRFTTTEHPQHA